MTIRKICVLGRGDTGVPLSAIIALKCPEIRVTVVQSNSETVFQWNTGRIPASTYVPGLEEFIRKCQNKNLYFTTNESLAIKEADAIFIISKSVLKDRGDGKNMVVDLSSVEDAAHLIAEHAESHKIVIENSSIPLKTAECVRNVFTYHRKPGIEFQVVSNPEFYVQGSSLKYLLSPDHVMVGSENTTKGLAAAKEVSAIYQRWVPAKNIFLSSNWSVELSKICISAMMAQMLGSVCAAAAMCEGSGANILTFVQAIPGSCGNALRSPDLIFSFGRYTKDLCNLIYMCDWLGLRESADYWRAVLALCNYHMQRFMQKFIWAIQEISNRKVAILGFVFFKDRRMTNESEAFDLCRSFIDSNAQISIHESVSLKKVVDDLVKAGCKASEDCLAVSFVVHDDPYKTAYQSQVIVVCGDSQVLDQLDYKSIYSAMMEPQYTLDRRPCLSQAILSRIGYRIHSAGMLS